MCDHLLMDGAHCLSCDEDMSHAKLRTGSPAQTPVYMLGGCGGSSLKCECKQQWRNPLLLVGGEGRRNSSAAGKKFSGR